MMRGENQSSVSGGMTMRNGCFLVLMLAACSASASSVSLDLDYLRVPYTDSADEFPGDTVDPPSFEKFTPIQPRFNLGYTHDRIWLRIKIINHAAEPVMYYLTTGQRYMRPLLLYERIDGIYRQIFRNDVDQPFEVRPLLLPDLTFPIELDAYETREMLAYIGSGGELALNVTLQDPGNVHLDYLGKLATTMFLEGLLVTLIFINVFYYRVVRRPAHLYYALQELMIGIYIAHMDGLAFQYLWPNLPSLNAYATRILGHGGNISILLFGAAYLSLSRVSQPMYRIYQVLIAFPVIFLVFLPVIEANLSNIAGLLGMSMSASFLLGCAVLAVYRGNRSAIYFLVGWLSLGLGILAFALSSLGILSQVVQPLTWIKLGATGEALVLLLGLFEQVRHINQERDASREALVTSLEARLQEARRALIAEEKSEANHRALAEKEKLLQTTSHDINQPIYALRLALKGFAPKLEDANLLEPLNRTLDHMEDILRQGLSADPSVNQSPPSTWGELFRQIVEDHRGEAMEASVQLRYQHSRIGLCVSIVPIRRVINNLVRNGIQHARARRILVGLRRGRDRLTIHVMDDGIGLPGQGEIAVTMGTGLGLTIVKDICNSEGWDLRCESRAGRGTHYVIEISL